MLMLRITGFIALSIRYHSSQKDTDNLNWYITYVATCSQGIDSFCELLTITKLPNNELTGIHTHDLPPLLL